MASTALDQNQVNICVQLHYTSLTIFLSEGCAVVKNTSSIICDPADLLVLCVPLPGHTQP